LNFAIQVLFLLVCPVADAAETSPSSDLRWACWVGLSCDPGGLPLATA